MRKSIKNPLKIIQNGSRNHQNPSKIDAQIEAQKKHDFFMKKSRLGFLFVPEIGVQK